MSAGKLSGTVRKYPLPFFAIAGIITGSVLILLDFHPFLSRYIWLSVLLVGGVPLSYKTIRNLLRGKFSVDVVAMMAIIAALVMDQAFAGSIIVLMQSGGESLENYAFSRATSDTRKLLERTPKVAHRKLNGTVLDIGAEQVAINDVLIVRQGDMIPVDGTVTSGYSEVDESSITGEPMPVVKERGDTVMSGTINISRTLEIRADRTSGESEYSRIVELVKQAQQDRAPVQRIADRYGALLIPVTLSVAFIGWLITGETLTILSVLVVATPCPLILATPIGMMGGLNKAAEKGIIIKGGTPLEELGRCDTVIFDKTGTLTHGKPVINRIMPIDKYHEVDLIRIIGIAESFSSHPLAVEITDYARERVGDLPLPENFLESPGMGTQAEVDGEIVRVGTLTYCMELAPDYGKLSVIEDIMAENREMVASFISVGRSLAGMILFSDLLRGGVKNMILDLKKAGITKTVLLTGDNEQNAFRISREAGISDYKADLKPEDKTNYVRRSLEDGLSVVMVGDGINDAPALASATVGIAMGAKGSEISSETADVIISVDDVLKVGDAIKIGRRTLDIVKQSIFAGMGLSIFFMIIASVGYIEPAVGAVIQEIVDAISILNAVRSRF